MAEPEPRTGATPGGHSLECIVVTPEETVLDTQAEFVALPLYDGEIGIAPGHSPLIGRLGFGEMRIKSAAGTTSYYVDGGFVQVTGHVVSILTNRAFPATKLNPKVAEEQLAAARARVANSDELLTIREPLEMQARAQLRLAKRAGS